MYYEIENYQIRPTSNNLCWELWHKRGVKKRGSGEVSEEWVFTGKYPSNLAMGLRYILEYMLMEGETPVRGIKAAREHFDEVYERVMQYKEVE